MIRALGLALVLSGCAHKAAAGWVGEPTAAGVPAIATVEPTADSFDALKQAGWTRVGWAYVMEQGEPLEFVCAAAEDLVRANGGGRARRHDARALALWTAACSKGEAKACTHASPAVAAQTYLALCRAGERDWCTDAAAALTDRAQKDALLRSECFDGNGQACDRLGRLIPAQRLPWAARGCVLDGNGCSALDAAFKR